MRGRAASHLTANARQLYNAEADDAVTSDRGDDAHEPLELHEFDVRAQCKSMHFAELQPFLRRMEDTLYRNSYFWLSRRSGDVLSTQRGVLRHNCKAASARRLAVVKRSPCAAQASTASTGQILCRRAWRGRCCCTRCAIWAS